MLNILGIINFNLGDWDWDWETGMGSGLVVPHENARMGDVRLRMAMAYAVDELVITEYFFHGLRVPATSIVTPGHMALLDRDLPGFPFDPERAKELLDEAGFLMGPDGWRTDQDGNEFIIRFAARVRDDWDFIAHMYMRQWADVGLNVQLYQDRFHDFADLVEHIWSADNWPGVDIFEAAWVAGFDPNPNQLWGHTVNNRPRFMNEEHERILARFGSPQAWDTDYLIDAYIEWQRAFHRNVPSFPTNWQVGLTAVNNRVTNFQLDTVLPPDGTRTSGGWHRIQVTRDVRY